MQPNTLPKAGDMVEATCNGRPVAGVAVELLKESAGIVCSADGSLAMCRDMKPVGLIRRGVLRLSRALHRCTARDARVIAEVNGKAFAFMVKPSDAGKFAGWKGEATNYLDVAGQPTLCKVTVTISIEGSDKWLAVPIEYDRSK